VLRLKKGGVMLEVVIALLLLIAALWIFLKILVGMLKT
jgi:hypothetical protein